MHQVVDQNILMMFRVLKLVPSCGQRAIATWLYCSHAFLCFGPALKDSKIRQLQFTLFLRRSFLEHTSLLCWICCLEQSSTLPTLYYQHWSLETLPQDQTFWESISALTFLFVSTRGLYINDILTDWFICSVFPTYVISNKSHFIKQKLRCIAKDV